MLYDTSRDDHVEVFCWKRKMAQIATNAVGSPAIIGFKDGFKVDADHMGGV